MTLQPVSLCLVMTVTFFAGCRGPAHRDELVASVNNPSHTWRASIVVRQFEDEGRISNSPITFVLLDQDTNSPSPDLSSPFPESHVVMKPNQCGPLGLMWNGDNTLKIICEKCGLALSEAGAHATGMGKVRIDYEGFPSVSSWETAPAAHRGIPE